jgi:hypothetical protein
MILGDVSPDRSTPESAIEFPTADLDVGDERVNPFSVGRDSSHPVECIRTAQ